MGLRAQAWAAGGEFQPGALGGPAAREGATGQQSQEDRLPILVLRQLAVCF